MKETKNRDFDSDLDNLVLWLKKEVQKGVIFFGLAVVTLGTIAYFVSKK